MMSPAWYSLKSPSLIPHSRPERTSFTSSGIGAGWKDRRRKPVGASASARARAVRAIRPSVTRHPATIPLLQFENLFHLGVPDDGLAMFWIEQAGHRLLHLIDQFVDDAVSFTCAPSRFACAVTAMLSTLMLKPTTTAFDALASKMSDSEIGPTPA